MRNGDVFEVFDKYKKDQQKSGLKMVTFIGCAWVLWAGFCLAVVGGLGYAAYHFITKFW